MRLSVDESVGDVSFYGGVVDLFLLGKGCADGVEDTYFYKSSDS